MDPFHVAASEGDIDTVRWMLRCGVNVNLCTSEFEALEAKRALAKREVALAKVAHRTRRKPAVVWDDNGGGGGGAEQELLLLKTFECRRRKRSRDREDVVGDETDATDDADESQISSVNNSPKSFNSSPFSHPRSSTIHHSSDVQRDDSLTPRVTMVSSRMTALHLAVSAGHADVVELLIDNGADVGSISQECSGSDMGADVGSSSTHFDEREEDDRASDSVSVYRAETNSFNPKPLSSSQSTPLLIAAQNGFVEIARLLLREDYNSSLAVCSSLASSGPHQDTTSSEYWYRHRQGDPNCQRNDLLHVPLGGGGGESPCRINFQDAEGFTALHWAAILGSEELVGLLLASGARTDIAANNGKRAVHYAKGRVLRLFNPSRVDDECWLHR